MNQATKIYIAATLLVALLPVTTATVNLDSVSYDPAVITAGDRVNLTVTLTEDILPNTVAEDGSNLDVYLQGDNKLTEEHIIIENDRDTPLYIPPGGRWNQRFQVRVQPDAPTGQYDFDVIMNVTDTDKAYTATGSFTMPVDREGVDIHGALVATEPRDIRPGDDNAALEIDWTNTGNKPIEDITVTPRLPDHVEPSYSADEEHYINRLDEAQTTTRRVNVDVDDALKPGRHTAYFTVAYEDQTGNEYEETMNIPLRIDGKPDLTVVTEAGNTTRGTTNQVRVTIQNTGSQDAETVSARTIIERSQPFSAEDRSVFLGEIQAGEERTAVFDVNVASDATNRDHPLRLQIRATGDSDEGDHSVYTWNETLSLTTAGSTTNWLPYLGILGALIAIAIYAYRRNT